MTVGAAPHGRPQVTPRGHVGRAGKSEPGEKEEEWTDCVAEDRWVFGITGDWSTATLDPEGWYSTEGEGGCKFMATWVREEKIEL